MDIPSVQTNDERPLGALFGQLMRDLGVLFRQELTIARGELTAKASKAAKDAAMLAVGGVVAYTGVLAILAAIILLLVRAGMPGWGAALLVGVIVAGIGGFLVDRGIKALKSDDLAPKETIRNLKEDVKWLKEQVS